MPRKNTPKLYDQPRKCGGKNCYTSRHEAETVKVQQEIINPDLELSIYTCYLCGQWHLTRTPKT